MSKNPFRTVYPNPHDWNHEQYPHPITRTHRMKSEYDKKYGDWWATQVDGSTRKEEELCAITTPFWENPIFKSVNFGGEGTVLLFETNEICTRVLNLGEWIIRDGEGNLSFMNPHEFHAMFEEKGGKDDEETQVFE